MNTGDGSLCYAGGTTMKRIILLLLVLSLLCGCSAPAGSETTAAPIPETERTTAAAPTTDLPATEASALAGQEALVEGTVLFYAQPDFEARLGTLVPLETVLAAPEEALLPRTHLYDDSFPGEAGLWLRLLDYALGSGYQGFSVTEGTLPEPELPQRRAMEFMYRIDGGKVLTLTRDGVTTVWYGCEKADAMEKFSLGLAAARELAAQAPRGDDWETAAWIMDYLADHVVYGERTPYYFQRGHLLYDALVEHDCVCSGYADSMYYLCNLCGVDCLSVFGLAKDLETAGGLAEHLWNLVRIYGSWYVCDPTMNAVSQLGGPAIAFALSSEAMYLMGGNTPTGEYTDESLIPVCDSSFDPVAAWNATPEGALRSWLWFAGYDALEPSFLLLYGGLLTAETQSAPSEDGKTARVELPYATFSAWADRFMSPEAREDFPILFSQGEDGSLILRKSETDTRSFWLSLTLGSVADNGDGTWTADLGGADAVFTITENGGLYRVETVSLTPKD